MTATPAMTILFGGSFDPVHEGHLKTATALRDLLGVPTVSLLPAARSPLKLESTADSHRLAMLQLAITDYSALTIDDRELRRLLTPWTPCWNCAQKLALMHRWFG